MQQVFLYNKYYKNNVKPCSMYKYANTCWYLYNLFVRMKLYIIMHTFPSADERRTEQKCRPSCTNLYLFTGYLYMYIYKSIGMYIYAFHAFKSTKLHTYVLIHILCIHIRPQMRQGLGRGCKPSCIYMYMHTNVLL